MQEVNSVIIVEQICKIDFCMIKKCVLLCQKEKMRDIKERFFCKIMRNVHKVYAFIIYNGE